MQQALETAVGEVSNEDRETLENYKIVKVGLTGDRAVVTSENADQMTSARLSFLTIPSTGCTSDRPYFSGATR